MESRNVSGEVHQGENQGMNDAEKNPPMGLPQPTQHHHQVGLEHQQNEFQFYHPNVFASDYVGQSTSFPVFPLMVEGNGGLPTSSMGDFFNGLHSHKQMIGEHRVPRVVPQPRRWGSSVTKAARTKRKMVRQMSLSSARFAQLLNNNSSGSSSSQSGSSSSSRKSTLLATTATQNKDVKDIYPFTTPDNKKLKVILQKELKNSDVNSLGRIVLPKKDSEANLPTLTMKEGIQVPIRDVDSTKVWLMRYRFWPNNKSRMYVLENTGEFVKQNGLKCGDFITLYQDQNKQLYISYRKVGTPSAAYPEALREETKNADTPMDGKTAEDDCQRMLADAVGGNLTDKKFNEVGNSPWSIDTSLNQQTMKIDEPSATNNGMEVGRDFLDSIFIDFVDVCDFSELERLSHFDDCDLSLYDYDDLMRDSDNSKIDGASSGDAGVDH